MTRYDVSLYTGEWNFRFFTYNAALGRRGEAVHVVLQLESEKGSESRLASRMTV